MTIAYDTRYSIDHYHTFTLCSRILRYLANSNARTEVGIDEAAAVQDCNLEPGSEEQQEPWPLPAVPRPHG